MKMPSFQVVCKQTTFLSLYHSQSSYLLFKFLHRCCEVLVHGGAFEHVLEVGHDVHQISCIVVLPLILYFSTHQAQQTVHAHIGRVILKDKTRYSVIDQYRWPSG